MWPTVSVEFGPFPGADVAVVSSERLFVRPPRSPLAVRAPNYGEGSVDVTVRNLLQTGSAIFGENATLPSAFRYRRARLTDEAAFSRLSRRIVQEMRLQVIKNVSISSHSDFDLQTSDMLNVVDVATLPALVLFGPNIVPNMSSYAVHGRLYYPEPGFGHEENIYDAPDTDDLTYGFVGVSASKQEVLNLQNATRMFFRHNKFLSMQKNPNDKAYGFDYFDMFLEASGLTYSVPPDQKSNLKVFGGSFTIRGFNFESHAGMPRTDRVARTHHVLPDCHPVEQMSATKTVFEFTFPYANDPVVSDAKDITSFTFPFGVDP